MQSDSNTDEIALQAAQWIVRLTAGDAVERESARKQFEAWQRQSAAHAKAAETLQGVVGHMDRVRAVTGGQAAPASAALSAALQGDRRARRAKRVAALLLACVLALPAWLTLQSHPPAYLLSDLRTATGQWQQHGLSDGSLVTLGSASAVDLRFDAERRVLSLVQGAILIEVARDARRPFLVETPEGSIRALGTRFIVDRRQDETVLTMLESSVEARGMAQRGASREAGLVVHAGQRVRITREGPGPVETIDAASLEEAWKNHLLVIRDRPLPQVLGELDRYRPGRILYEEAQLQGLDVAAVLPLDDTDKALSLLAESIPGLRIRRFSPYLILVDRPPAAQP